MKKLTDKKQYVCNLEELKKYIKFSKDEEEKLKEVVKIHPMKVSKYYLSLIDKNDPNDPIKKMIIPSVEELDSSGEYDTSGEKQNTKSEGLQHKYYQTALILSTNQCAAYCRFCFRKRLVGKSNKEIINNFQKAVDYIKKNKEIDNVLITGGDSFALETKVIEKFIKAIIHIPHIKYIRFGTRIPMVLPSRIYEDKKLLRILKKYSKLKKIYIITHFNHPRELTNRSIKAIKALQSSNIKINNQTVLMRGVNDNSNVLAKLFLKLTRLDVFPYYLFQCRPVKRVKKGFQVPIKKGWKIFEDAKKQVKESIICKRIKYVMSHPTGKIEIVGMLNNNEVILKYHQPKNLNDSGKILKKKLTNNTAWFDKL
jgi:lysine 2,3-aminomutase